MRVNPFLTPDDLAAQAEQVAEKARQMTSAEEVWYRGYADALQDAARVFDPEQVYRSVEREYRRQDAARHLQQAFNIPEDGVPDDDETEDDIAERYTRMLTSLEPHYGDLRDHDNEKRLLDDLVESYEDHFDCNVAENDTWETVVEQFLAELSITPA